jgi:hypothetical protein
MSAGVVNPLPAAMRIADDAAMAATRRADMFTADGKSATAIWTHNPGELSMVWPVRSAQLCMGPFRRERRIPGSPLSATTINPANSAARNPGRIRHG